MVKNVNQTNTPMKKKGNIDPRRTFLPVVVNDMYVRESQESSSRKFKGTKQSDYVLGVETEKLDKTERTFARLRASQQ